MTSVQTGWVFPNLNGGEGTGFRDAGIALFSTDAIRSMTREVLQNSIDAGQKFPVRVTFSRQLIDRIRIPGVDQLTTHLHRCEADANARFAPKEGARWLENGGGSARAASAILAGEKIAVLRIRDENTKGLVGVEATGKEVDDSNWDRLIRKKGTPQGSGPAGGSFGVGQRAPFAASQLRTLFYGTKTNEGFAFIGKSIWWSLRNEGEDADHTQNVGYWGRVAKTGARVLPVIDVTSVHEFFQRTTLGADLFLLGVQERNESNELWRTSVLDAVLISYFAAIQQGRLEVVLDDGPAGPPPTTLTMQTIVKLLEERVAEAAKPVGRKKHGEAWEELSRTQFFLSALVSGERHEGTCERLGKMRLHVLRKEHAPSRIAWMRSPLMLVTSSGNNTMRDYAAVFVCDDEKGNAALRRLEGPEHNHWDNKVSDRSEIIRERNEFVRGVLEKMAGLDTTEEQDLPQLAAYLPEDIPSGGTGTGPKEVTEHRQPKETGRRVPKKGSATVSKGRLPPPVITREPDPSTGADVGDGLEGAGGNGGENEGTGGLESGGPEAGSGVGDLGDGVGQLPRLRQRDVRYRTWFDANGDCTVVLNTRRGGRGDVSVRVVGADGPPAAAEIVEAFDQVTGEAITTSGGKLVGISVLADQPLRLTLRLNPNRRAALNLEVSE